MTESNIDAKLNHLRTGVIKLQKSIKELVNTREIFSRNHGRGFTLLRSNQTNGHWEFCQNGTAIVLKSGLKTAANQISVWQNNRPNTFRDIGDLKNTQSVLLKLKNSLEKRPLRHHKKNDSGNKRRKGQGSINLPMEPPPFDFFILKDLFIPDTEVLGVFFETSGRSSTGAPFLIFDFFKESAEKIGTTIWIQGEDPYCYNKQGEDATEEESAEMWKMLSELALQPV